MKKYYLENEVGIRYELNDGVNTAFKLTDKLGYSYKIDFEQLENNFIENKKKLEQQRISGTLSILNEKKIIEFINFLQSSSELKFIQEKNDTLYYIDVISEEFKIENTYNTVNPIKISFKTKSLWYEAKEIVYTIEKETNEITWDFSWNAKFSGYDVRNLVYENKGHVPAPFLLEINSAVSHPKIQIYDNNNLLKSELNLTTLNIANNEKFIYCTKDTNLMIYKENKNVTTNLFDMLDVNKNNFFKLPVGFSKIKLSGDSDITTAKLTIYEQYLAV